MSDYLSRKEIQGAAMYDPNILIAAGIDPKTGLPLAMRGGPTCPMDKNDIRKQLRIVDEQNAINRYTWYNLPKGLNGQLIERILYYRGQGAAFFLNGKFYFLPYTLAAPENSTGIDVYGRFTGITPLPFNGTSTDNNGKDKPWIQGKIFLPKYEHADIEEFLDKSEDEIRQAITESCVLLHDYTPQISQTNIARQVLNDPLLGVMSECIPLMRTALFNSTGVQGMRVGSEDEAASVYAAANGINKAAVEGRRMVPVVGNLDFQDLSGGQVAKAEEFLLAMQSLDNYRLSLYGLDNGGLFQKKSHMLEAEQEMNAGNVGLIAEDGLRNRQEFCDIFNSWFGTEMWCEPSEVTLGMDRDGDMVAGGDEPTSNSPANNNNTEVAAE